MSYFYQDNLISDSIHFSSDESKHIAKSLRLKVDDFVFVTDGKGTLAKARLTSNNKDNCEAIIEDRTFENPFEEKRMHLAVAPTKNPDRMEWLVEKAVEIGIYKISFLICDHSERKFIDLSRLQRIAIAALKQSKGTFLPELSLVNFDEFIRINNSQNAAKFICYCENRQNCTTISSINYDKKETIFLIGPEGDFSPNEVASAKVNGYKTITLGNKILRTETAALCVIIIYQL